MIVYRSVNLIFVPQNFDKNYKFVFNDDEI